MPVAIRLKRLNRLPSESTRIAYSLRFINWVAHFLLVRLFAISFLCYPLPCWCVKPVRLVFLSAPNASAREIYKGLGTPRPICAVSFVACRRGTRHWRGWRFLWEVTPST